MGLVRRRLYKAPRPPARAKDELHKSAPIGCPDATPSEVLGALFVIGEMSGVIAGRGVGYDPLKDEYVLIAKHLDGGERRGVPTGKARDVIVKGEAVAQVIMAARILNGGRPLRRMSAANAAGAR